MKVAIINHTSVRNRGNEALLVTIMNEVSKLWLDVQFYIGSIDTEYDSSYDFNNNIIFCRIGYSSSFKSKDNFSCLFVQNQRKIGKAFDISPDSKNNDGVFEICMIKNNRNLILNVLVLLNIIKKHRLRDKDKIFISAKKAIIKTKKKQHFMGDGEILEYSKKFKIRCVPKAINVLY